MDTKRILMFEENYDSLKSLKEHLEERFGWQVELTAEESIRERLAETHFDLILVDLMIAPVSLNDKGKEVKNVHFDGVNWQETGREFLRRLRRGEFVREEGTGTPAEVPVIAFSAVASDTVKKELSGELKVSDYLSKPFRLEEIVARIREVMKE